MSFYNESEFVAEDLSAMALENQEREEALDALHASRPPCEVDEEEDECPEDEGDLSDEGGEDAYLDSYMESMLSGEHFTDCGE